MFLLRRVADGKPGARRFRVGLCAHRTPAPTPRSPCRLFLHLEELEAEAGGEGREERWAVGKCVGGWPGRCGDQRYGWERRRPRSCSIGGLGRGKTYFARKFLLLKGKVIVVL